MAREVYSTRFILAEAEGGQPNPTYTVPAGYVAVVHSIDALIDPTADGPYAIAAIAGTPFWIDYVASAASLGTATWRGRQVVNAGEELAVGCANAVAFVAASGYLLTA